MPPHVAIVGAGIAGLSAAVSLLAQGLQVTVLEKERTVGGKIRKVCVEGRPIDAGPTVFTMRWVFDQLMERAGRSLDAAVTLRKVDILARHYWRDGGHFDLHADPVRATQAVAEFAGQQEAEGFRRFLRDTEAIFDGMGIPFMRAQGFNASVMTRTMGARGIAALLRAGPQHSMWKALGRYFKNPQLQQLFGRYATYYGASPFDCPPNLLLVAHAEQQGVWILDDGMHSLAAALSDAIEEMGGTIRLGTAVSSLCTENSRISGLELAANERLQADAVILNADCAALAAGLFGQAVAKGCRAPPSTARSLSAITTMTVAHSSGFPLHRHNVFFSEDYRSEFREIFTHGKVPAVPTVYICAQDRCENAVGEGLSRERLFLLVNAPANGDAHHYTKSELDRCQERTFSHLQACGLTLTDVSTQTRIATPENHQQLYPATGGSLYGRATHSWADFFLRPGNRSRVPGLYLAGGSVHPGPGIPTASLSGQNAADCLMADLGSISRSTGMAMRGGISTGSAMIAGTGSPSSP